MEKSRAIELLEHLAWDRDICRNPYGDALNMAIDALKAQLSPQGTTFDMISRQVAIDALAKIAREKFNMSDEYNHYLAGLMDGELAIKGLPTIQPEVLACGNGELVAKPEPQWIPCSEKLPEEAGYYITSSEYGGVTVDFYYDHFWNSRKNAYKVLAWMPLPKIYKPNK